MKWLFLNDIKLSVKGFLLYYVLLIFSYITKYKLPIHLLQGLVYFYCTLNILYSDFSNHTACFYTLFPKKRYFLIIQKNITILIFIIILNMSSFLLFSDTINYFINSVCLYWLMGSILLLFFFHFKIAYASSLMQIAIYCLYFIMYSMNKYFKQFELNNILILTIVLILNTLNIILYRSKNFMTNE